MHIRSNDFSSETTGHANTSKLMTKSHNDHPGLSIMMLTSLKGLIPRGLEVGTQKLPLSAKIFNYSSDTTVDI